MRPFGALPRPRSRFERPRQSWMRRIFQATQLRFGFLVLYVLIAIVPFCTLYAMGRDSGYFYSTRERVALWKKLPDANAIAALNAVYQNDSQGPIMVILRHYQQPCEYRGEFLKLWQDPQWAAQAQAANQAGFDRALQVLDAEWRYYRFDNLLKHSDSARLFSDKQRRRLEELRKESVEAILREQPVDETRVQALRYRIWGIFSREPALDSAWRQAKIREGRIRQQELAQKIPTERLPEDQLEGLRRLQVQTKVGGVLPGSVSMAQGLAQQFEQKALHDLGNPPILDVDLRILAHCRKLAPTLSYSALSQKLSSDQRALLDSLSELTSNP